MSFSPTSSKLISGIDKIILNKIKLLTSKCIDDLFCFESIRRILPISYILALSLFITKSTKRLLSIDEEIDGKYTKAFPSIGV